MSTFCALNICRLVGVRLGDTNASHVDHETDQHPERWCLHEWGQIDDSQKSVYDLKNSVREKNKINMLYIIIQT